MLFACQARLHTLIPTALPVLAQASWPSRTRVRTTALCLTAAANLKQGIEDIMDAIFPQFIAKLIKKDFTENQAVLKYALTMDASQMRKLRAGKTTMDFRNMSTKEIKAYVIEIPMLEPERSAASVRDIIQTELDIRGRRAVDKDTYSLCRALLWLQREFHFMSIFVGGLASNRDTVPNILVKAFKSTMAPYMNFLAQQVAKMCLGIAPSRKDVMKGLQSTDDDLMAEELQEFAVALQEVYEPMHRVIVEMGVHFTNKSSV